MFIDEVKIFVKAGDGGNGCVSFRREKYVPMGGPNGGDGGNGGDITIRTSSSVSTLLDLKYQQHYMAKRGGHGKGKDQHGKNGDDLHILVPVGTLVKALESGELLVDLTREGEEFVCARGGRGGKGNARFKTSTNRTPMYADEGEKGTETWLLLELKLMADVGLVGLPNAGKSTLISRVSQARPKIADYPFTTLTPHLGMVSWDDGKGFVIADIPGLIEGAHAGKGLGFQFLRHIERTAFLAFLIDISSPDPTGSLEVLRSELGQFNSSLLERPFVVVASKLDIKGDGKGLRKLTSYCKKFKYDIISVSAVTGKGIDSLILYLGKKVEELKGQSVGS
ncbi:MAG: GTPase ObgE [Nitrospirae bacterium]|nr:GTPase ObgE [Nitrospirota bacterium]